MELTENSRVYQDLNRRLPDLCEEVCKALTSQAGADKTTRILQAHIRKAQCTLRAINLLHDAELWEPAQILVRAIFELQIGYNHFLRMYENNPKGACARLMDAMALQTLKHFRTAQSALDVGQSIKGLEEAEKVILQRYEPKELEKLRRYGFAGVSIEQAAQAIEQGDIYNLVYRLFSRNVHSTDHVEMMTLDNFEDDAEREAALAARNELSFYIAGICVASMLDLTNRIRKCGLDDEIREIADIFDSMKNKIAEPPA